MNPYPISEIVDAAALTPAPSNPNILTPENEAKLEASIKRFGFFRPVIVRELAVLKLSHPPKPVLEIIGGYHRWEIGSRLGMKIPIMNLGPISDQEAKEILLADNARYGMDDTLALAEFLKDLGGNEFQDFLPYTETDIADIFSSLDITLEDLEIDNNFESNEANDTEPPAPKPPKTHTIMRFKVPLADAERITAMIASTQKHHGLTGSDELTNAGDALVHLLFEIGSEA